jgi:hypothetical protein
MSYEQEMQQRWIARRDANAFTELVQQHAGMVFATCRSVLGDATETPQLTVQLRGVNELPSRHAGESM